MINITHYYDNTYSHFLTKNFRNVLGEFRNRCLALLNLHNRNSFRNPVS